MPKTATGLCLAISEAVRIEAATTSARRERGGDTPADAADAAKARGLSPAVAAVAAEAAVAASGVATTRETNPMRDASAAPNVRPV